MRWCTKYCALTFGGLSSSMALVGADWIAALFFVNHFMPLELKKDHSPRMAIIIFLARDLPALQKIAPARMLQLTHY